MKLIRSAIFYLLAAVFLGSCGMYSFSGADTSGAKTFSVDYFKPVATLASPLFSQQFTEELKDLILQQSTLSIEEKGDLQFEGSVVGYDIKPVSVQSNETASLNRLTITIKVNYVNSIQSEKNFERSFSKYADYDSNQDILSIEESLHALIIEQISQEVFNASLGNW